MPTKNINEKLAEKVMSRCVVLMVELGRPGVNRTIPQEQLKAQADVDETAWAAQKRLFDSPELSLVGREHGRIRRYIYSKCLMRMGGAYIIALPQVAEVDEQIESMFQGLEKLEKDACETYIQYREEAKGKLRALWNERDYDTPTVFAAQFQKKKMYISFEVPDGLQKVSAAFYKEQQQTAVRFWSEATEEIKATLRYAFKDLIQHLVKILTGGEDGKAKGLKQPTIDKMFQFIAEFKSKNVVDDTELANLVNQCKNVLGATDAQTLRESEEFREGVIEQFKSIKENLEKMVIVRPRRKITFDKEE